MRRTWRWLWRIVVLLACILPFYRHAPQVTAQGTPPDSDEEIVYLDGDHVIRVYDPKPPAGGLQVEWFSPTGGWLDLTLADVTGDGDEEIIAIKQEGSGGRLTIFDPVAQDSPDDQVQELNGVPWATLFETTIPNVPGVVVTGEFDVDHFGPEIVYNYVLDDRNDHFVVLRQTGLDTLGRSWEQQRAWDLEGRWNAAATGNIDGDLDELGLVSTARGELAIYKIEPAVTRFFSNINNENRWTNLAFGQYLLGDGDELGAVRDADFPLASAWVFRYNPATNTMVDHYSERLSPSPKVMFFGDIGTVQGSNGDDELMLLRDVRQELGQRARLLVRDNQPANDGRGVVEELLDGDNEYNGGDAGDIDGDGRDEIVLVRNNRIRIYPDPQSVTTYQLIQLFTDGHVVKVGNLDAAGLGQDPRLAASETLIVRELEQGESSTATVTITDAETASSVPFDFEVEGADGWAEVRSSSDVTTSTLTIRFDTTGLQPGTYAGRIVVDAQMEDVDNDPLNIDLALVVDAVVNVEPNNVSFVDDPCEESLEPRDQMMTLSASSALTYTAQIEGNPDWVTVIPEVRHLPDESTLTVSVIAGVRPQPSARAVLVIGLEDQPGITNRIPITVVCAHHKSYVPLAAK